MTIVIAEDEPKALRGIRRLIELEGREEYEVVGEAYDGREALEMIQRLTPDVCITDIRMPVMDGLSLIKAARAYGLATRFVIVSAYEEFSVARQAIKLGVVDYLVKPILEDEIRELLAHLSRTGGEPTPAGKLCEEYPQAHLLVRKSLKIIEESYAARISQKEVAESLGITPEYFSYLFSRDIGKPFGKFLRSYRMDRAKDLLQDKSVTTEEAAARVGYTDAKYFARLFREETGMSVAQFREQTDM